MMTHNLDVCPESAAVADGLATSCSGSKREVPKVPNTKYTKYQKEKYQIYHPKYQIHHPKRQNTDWALPKRWLVTILKSWKWELQIPTPNTKYTIESAKYATPKIQIQIELFPKDGWLQYWRGGSGSCMLRLTRSLMAAPSPPPACTQLQKPKSTFNQTFSVFASAKY